MYRSLLFIPGNNPSMIQNADVFLADALIFDLEDSVAIDEKDNARNLIGNFLKTLKILAKEIHGGGGGRLLCQPAARVAARRLGLAAIGGHGRPIRTGEAGRGDLAALPGRNGAAAALRRGPAGLRSLANPVRNVA